MFHPSGKTGEEKKKKSKTNSVCASIQVLQVVTRSDKCYRKKLQEDVCRSLDWILKACPPVQIKNIFGGITE